MFDVARRINAITDAAENLANDIRAEAEQEATRYLQERRRETDRLVADRVEGLSALKDELEARADRVTQEVQALGRAIDDATSSIRSLAESQREASAGGADEGSHAPTGITAYPGTGATRGDEGASHASAPQESAPLEPAGTFVRRRGRDDGDAVLRATQMAVGGSSREEIERVISTEFDVSDPAAVVDEILGDA